MNGSNQNGSQLALIFVLGAPGAGKDVQCSLLSEKLGYVHLSSGDLIRTERDMLDSQYGTIISEILKEPGNFVPSNITCTLIGKAIASCPPSSTVLLDGFPINQSNLSTWEAGLGSTMKLRSVVFLDIPEELSLIRCLGRGRSDDQEQSVRKRYAAFRRESLPVIEHYKAKGVLKTVDGIGETHEVFERLLRALQSS
ncbi:hypothetical protein RvY_12700 [Ramazzottius varieornatus]|uniref:Adenylate kinase n=1 Tax=Ramazzottius varieornatus TaxID=947166 RepID=A0A1D1VKD9_RAMVA|nr:hypothetical protein RvY_12700 [Ramazzottius varieornatus]